MVSNRIKQRAEYYTDRMPLWKKDKQDILQYILMYFDCCRNEMAYMTLQTKLMQLGLMQVCRTIISYIDDEQERFDEYKQNLPSGTPNEFIWAKIYEEMDTELNFDIQYAKKRASIHNSNVAIKVLTYVIVIASVIYSISKCC